MTSRIRTPYARLRAVAEHVPKARVIADIGCDHGLLGALLLQARPEAYIVAGDVSRASLAKAQRRLEVEFPGRFETRLGYGLQILSPGEAEVIVLAGMGGRTISTILRDSPAAARAAGCLLLLPHTGAGELRRDLAETDFRIEDEWIVEEDGRFYPLLRAASGGARREEDPLWYEVGRVLGSRGDPVERRYVQSLLRQARGVLQAVGQADPARSSLVRAYIRRLEEVLS